MGGAGAADKQKGRFKMRSPQESAIGGIGAEAYEDATEVPSGTVTRQVPRAVAPQGGPEFQELIDRHLQGVSATVAQMSDTVEVLTKEVNHLLGRAEALEAIAHQQRGQVAQLEQVLPQLEPKIAAAMNMLTQRIDALSRQVQGNLRLAALDAAVKGKGPGDRNEAVLKAAEAYMSFLMPPPPQVEESEADPNRTVN
jgi:ABC-type transporter Mla subunit MlaD